MMGIASVTMGGEPVSAVSSEALKALMSPARAKINVQQGVENINNK